MIEIAPRHKTRLTYDQAWLYCLTLSYNGHKDWRLPSHREWIDTHEIAASVFNDDDDRAYLTCPVQAVRTK